MRPSLPLFRFPLGSGVGLTRPSSQLNNFFLPGVFPFPPLTRQQRNNRTTRTPNCSGRRSVFILMENLESVSCSKCAKIACVMSTCSANDHRNVLSSIAFVNKFAFILSEYKNLNAFVDELNRYLMSFPPRSKTTTPRLCFILNLTFVHPGQPLNILFRSAITAYCTVHLLTLQFIRFKSRGYSDREARTALTVNRGGGSKP